MNPNNSAVMQNVSRYRLGCFFDTYTLAAATAVPTNIRMFSEKQGSSKGPELTNMLDSGQLPNGWHMKVFAVRVVLLGMIMSDVLELMKKYTLKLRVGQKTFLEAPIEYHAGGAGPVGAVAIPDAGTLQQNWTNGVADPRATNAVGQEYAFDIPGGFPLGVELQGSTFNTAAAPGTGIFMRVYLDGLIAEPVQ